MNWKNEAIDRLKRYEAMKSAVQSIPDELRSLEMEATSIKAVRTDKVQVKSGANDCNEALLNNMVRREELQWTLNQAKLWVKTTDTALSNLIPEEKLILHRMYILPERGCLDRLCMELGCEQSTIYRKRDKALYRFTISLYGFVETQFERSSTK